VIPPHRSIREIGDLVQQARDELRRAIRSLDGILHAHPSLPALIMRLQVARAALTDVLVELRDLQD
jgi:hypothetical protein